MDTRPGLSHARDLVHERFGDLPYPLVGRTPEFVAEFVQVLYGTHFRRVAGEAFPELGKDVTLRLRRRDAVPMLEYLDEDDVLPQGDKEWFEMHIQVEELLDDP